MSHLNLIYLIPFVLLSLRGNAQVSEDSELYKTLLKSDSLLFEEGFNNCDLELVDRILSTDFEFYHDQNGIQDKSQFLNTFKESLCSTPNRKPIRKLINGSMNVFPLFNEGELYGAIQKAKHEFYIKEPEKDLYITGVAKFTHLWLLEENQWKLKRSLSYDHQSPQPDYGPKFEAHFNKPLFSSDNDIEKLLAQHKIPSVAIGYINGGELQQIRLFGEKRHGNPVDCNAIYKIASLTKPITAVITLKLVESGLWDLDEPVFNYHIDEDVREAPELASLTTRHILSHQSGFPNWRHLTDTNKLTFEFKPGTQFQYSGEGYDYLRKALETKFNKGLEVLAEELLFKPLGMNNTHFNWDETMSEDDYAVENDEFGEPIPYTKYTTVSAAANVLTTIQDYGTFMVHLIQGAGLADSLYQDFLTPHSKKQEGIHWGLGCQLLFDLDEQGEFAVMHGGGDYGLKTVMLLLPKSNKGLLIFSNSENGMVLWRKLIEEYFGEVGKEIVRRNLD